MKTHTMSAPPRESRTLVCIGSLPSLSLRPSPAPYQVLEEPRVGYPPSYPPQGQPQPRYPPQQPIPHYGTYQPVGHATHNTTTVVRDGPRPRCVP